MMKITTTIGVVTLKNKKVITVNFPDISPLDALSYIDDKYGDQEIDTIDVLPVKEWMKKKQSK